ncbi:MAG: STAS domain-containing protein [Desulfobacterales bacterium]|nr:STAS domain-containing protein [Desulfobacterales bacterium]
MLKKFLPFLEWFKDYSKNDLKTDFIAGLTVALVLIPQSMAYAQLAGLPAYYGLYAAFLPPMMASLFGSSRQLATGPVAVVSLMTAASLEPLATAGGQEYIIYTVLLAFIVGVFQLSLGILKLGVVVNFLSHPVVNGFTNAAAIIIATSQLSKIFGVYVDNATHHYETIIAVIEAAFHYTHWPTFFMGIFAFGIMYFLKKLAPKIPNVLVAVAVTTVIAWGVGFKNDATTTISNLEHTESVQLIKNFNTNVKEVANLSEERKSINKKIEEAKSTKDPISILDAEHALNVINVNIEKHKYEIHDAREKIRNFLFKGKDENGSLKFNLKDKNNRNETGPTWRIKIGNNPINLEKITMMGGGAVVGDIPKGLPSFSLPKLNLKIILHLLPFAAIISLLGFMEAISIAKAMAAKTGQRLDPNQELIGQGLANMLGAISKSYPTSGSFSRSAVNLQAGAISGLSSVFTSLTVVIVLLFFTPLLYFLPQSVLAAVIMMAVISLINVSGFIHAWRAQWYDGAISILSFIATLAFAPHLDKGIMIGVVLSIGVFLYKSMKPVVSSLSMHADESFRDSMLHSLGRCEYIDLISFEGPLFFANASYLEDQINDRIMHRKHLKHIVIAGNGINDIDASGEEALSLIIDRVRSSGIDMSFAAINDSVMAVLKRTHLLEKIGIDHIYPNMEKAIWAIHPKVHKLDDKRNCPFQAVINIIKNN